MLLDYLSGSLDLSTFFIDLLLCLPGYLLAMSMHEAAHAYAAYRCGDPTAQMLGRLTLNPLKHVDPMGLFMLFFAGFGWAKAVPVNPRNFKHYRRDDFFVSVAGITANLIQFVIGYFVMFGLLVMAFNKVQYVLPGWVNEDIVAYALGDTMGYVYQMLTFYVSVNITLAVFNLLPIPPLDGYHILNDLVLKRPLFADIKAQRIGYMVLMALIFSGFWRRIISALSGGAYELMSNVATAIFRAFGWL